MKHEIMEVGQEKYTPPLDEGVIIATSGGKSTYDKVSARD